MRVTIVGLLTVDFEQVSRRGLYHPLLGAILDAGCYAHVAGIEPGRAGLAQIIEAVIEKAGAAKVQCRIISSSLTVQDEPASGIQVCREFLSVERAQAASENWHVELATGSALSLIVADDLSKGSPLWTLCSYRLPCMGPLAPASLEDICATWLRLGGGSPAKGHFLLEEPRSPVDTLAESRLTERLRQLYGE